MIRLITVDLLMCIYQSISCSCIYDLVNQSYSLLSFVFEVSYAFLGKYIYSREVCLVSGKFCRKKSPGALYELSNAMHYVSDSLYAFYLHKKFRLGF